MSECSVEEKIRRLDESPAPERWTRLRRLAGVLALKQFPDGTFHEGHWWRGPLLYSLVKRYRPRHVLEFGTARGYGAVCMAMASLEGGFACTVWSIDVLSSDAPQIWPIQMEQGPRLERTSRSVLWQLHVPDEIQQRIQCVTGDSRRVMRRWRREGRPGIEFCFIDGGHDRWTARHDFIAALRVAQPGCTFIFDDYTPRKGYGVKRLVDEHVALGIWPHEVEILDMGCRNRTIHGEDVPHRMAVVAGEAIGASPLAQFFGAVRAEWWQRAYALYDTVRRLAGRLRAGLRAGA